MKRLFLVFLFSIIMVIFLWGTSIAGCWVDDGTFYAKKKNWMVAFAMYADRDGEFASKKKALQMINDGRISSCTRATCFVIKRDGGVVNVQILGIGKVWIYKTFLNCN